MATPTWVTLANANTYSQTGSVSAVSNFTSATDISPGGNTAGLAYQTSPAQIYPGQMWRFMANGIWSSTSSPGLSIGVYYGGAAGSPLCYGSVPAASAFTNCASIPWSLYAVGRVTQPGTSGIWNVIGVLSGLWPSQGPGTTGAATSPSVTTPMPAFTLNGQYDTSVSKIITLAATCTASSSSNAVTVYNWAIEYMTEP